MTPEAIQSRVLHKEARWLVLDKPAGIAVHAGPKGGASLEDYFGELRFGYKETPALAHRLDRDTSGCLILGRNHAGLKRLGGLFASGKIGKVYWAVVHGRPSQDEGVIDLALKKRTKDRRSWWMEAHPDGQEARTRYRVMGSDRVHSWVEFRPETGRTHQIRVHAASLGCPLLGDPIYGIADGSSLHLHSRSVMVPFAAEAPVYVEAPIADAMMPQFVVCGYRSEQTHS